MRAKRGLQRTAGVLHSVHSRVPLHVSPPLSWGGPGLPFSSDSCRLTLKPALRVTTGCHVSCKHSQPALGKTCAAWADPLRHGATPPTLVFWAPQYAALVSPGQRGPLGPAASRPVTCPGLQLRLLNSNLRPKPNFPSRLTPSLPQSQKGHTTLTPAAQ